MPRQLTPDIDLTHTYFFKTFADWIAPGSYRPVCTIKVRADDKDAGAAISKYIQGCQTLPPASSVLLILSSPPDLLYRRTRTQPHWVAPDVSNTVSACKSANSDLAIIIHGFSNGESHQTLNLLRAYHEINSSPFPSHVTILDSCPGRGTFKRSVLAFSSALPKSQTLRFLLLLLNYLIVSIYWLASVLFAIPDPMERIRQALNDKEPM